MRKKSPKSLLVQKNISLKKHTTFGIGGKTEFFFNAKTPESVIHALAWANSRGIAFRIFAGGSNVFFSDGTQKGLTVRVCGGKIKKEKSKLCVDAGVSLSRLVQRSILEGLGGLETLSGIPGTVGGAIYGNAGAYGKSIGESVSEVQIYDGKKIFWMKTPRTIFGYRDSIFKKKKWIILRAKFLLQKKKKEILRAESLRIIRVRKAKYPPKIKCPGSFFKNILVKNISRKTMKKIDQSEIIEGKIPAGYILESIGAKGMREGGAEVAHFHANVIVNKRNATASDVIKLSEKLKKRAEKKFGINLEEEVVKL